MMRQHAATQGLLRSPIRPHFQIMPVIPVRRDSKKLVSVRMYVQVQINNKMTTNKL